MVRSPPPHQQRLVPVGAARSVTGSHGAGDPATIKPTIHSCARGLGATTASVTMRLRKPSRVWSIELAIALESADTRGVHGVPSGRLRWRLGLGRRSFGCSMIPASARPSVGAAVVLALRHERRRRFRLRGRPFHSCACRDRESTRSSTDLCRRLGRPARDPLHAQALAGLSALWATTGERFGAHIVSRANRHWRKCLSELVTRLIPAGRRS